jgi:hypothetical protein
MLINHIVKEMLVKNGGYAIYIDFEPNIKGWETFEEEAIFLTYKKELYGLKISLSETLEYHPDTSLEHIFSRCIESGWIHEIIEGKSYISYHFFKPEGKTKVFDWIVNVDTDKDKIIKGIEILFLGDASKIKRNNIVESQKQN